MFLDPGMFKLTMTINKPTNSKKMTTPTTITAITHTSRPFDTGAAVD